MRKELRRYFFFADFFFAAFFAVFFLAIAILKVSLMVTEAPSRKSGAHPSRTVSFEKESTREHTLNRHL